MLRLALVAGLLVSACYRERRDEATERRLALLEQRLDAQDKKLEEMRTQNSASVEMTVIAARLQELAQKIAELETKLAQGSARPQPRKRISADPALTYAVPVGTSPSLGAPDAKVTIIMAYEFACRFCRKAWDTMDKLRAKYGNDVRVVYKQYVVHADTATPAAYAACAAHKQGKWRVMADTLWTKAFDARKFDQAHIDALAKKTKLDMKRYAADTEGPCPTELRDDWALLKKFAVTATPTFFINGRVLEGAKDQAEFERLVDEELAKASAAIKAGVPADKVYEQEVLGKGLTEVPST
jgi:protein-disulfide isomerase